MSRTRTSTITGDGNIVNMCQGKGCESDEIIEDRIPVDAEPTPTIPIVPQPSGVCTNSLKGAAEFLLDNSRISFQRTHYNEYRRYVELNRQQIFDNLVTLYAELFKSQWQDFHRLLDTIPDTVLDTSSATGRDILKVCTYAARCYVSMWFIDLYVSNREAAKKISTLDFNIYFSVYMTRVSHEYDQYLTLLNASIRPTHIKFASEDALYIPIINKTVNAKDPNPFNINNFNADETLFYGLVRIMKHRKQWTFTPLSTDALGRPAWLFDWHEETVAGMAETVICAWFHAEGNFNLEDVTLAYILGVACSTPKRGPRDVDDWQPVPVPSNPQRKVDRRFYGSFEIRTTETKEKQFRIIDWVYYYRVNLNFDIPTRTRALRILSIV